MSAKIHDGLGGSDIAAIVDLYREEGAPRLDPFKSALDVYSRIVNPGEEQRKISFRARIGTIVEPQIFKEYAERHGWNRNLFRRNVELSLDGTPQFRGELDGVSDKLDRGVDCKLVGRYAQAFYGEEGTDDMPANYLLQLAWYRQLSGVACMDLACWMDSEQEGNHYKEYIYEKDSELEASVMQCARRFWTEHVEKKEPPKPQYASDDKALGRLFPKQELALRDATEDEVALIARMQVLRADEKTAKDALKLLQNELKAAIGLHEGLTLKGGAQVTWKANKSSDVTDWKTVCREALLMLKEGKELTHDKLQAIAGLHTKTKAGARPLKLPPLEK